jgi:hypothetical protein
MKNQALVTIDGLHFFVKESCTDIDTLMSVMLVHLYIFIKFLATCEWKGPPFMKGGEQLLKL